MANTVALTVGTNVWVFEGDDDGYTVGSDVKITRNFTYDITVIPKPGNGAETSGRPTIYRQMPVSDVIRIDCVVTDSDNRSGNLAYVNPDSIIKAVRDADITETGQFLTIPIGDDELSPYTFEGLVRSVNYTKRAGEGNKLDLSIVFEVGDVQGVIE